MSISVDLPKFKQQVAALKSVTADEVRTLCEPLGDKWKQKYPGFSRNYGAGILKLVEDGITTEVFLDEDFKNDGLFCQYYYEINLDHKF